MSTFGTLEHQLDTRVLEGACVCVCVCVRARASLAKKTGKGGTICLVMATTSATQKKKKKKKKALAQNNDKCVASSCTYRILAAASLPKHGPRELVNTSFFSAGCENTHLEIMAKMECRQLLDW